MARSWSCERRLFVGNTGADALARAEVRGDRGTSDSVEVPLKTGKMMFVVVDAGRAESALLSEVLEEPTRSPFERSACPARATPPAEAGNDQPQHLLDRVACEARDLLPSHRRGRPGAALLRPRLHERVDMSR